MSSCSSVPALETPPGTSSSGKHLVIIDNDGNTRKLVRPNNRSVLVFDGDDIYFVDGTDEFPIVLNNIAVAGSTAVLNGVAGINAAGRFYRLVNESDAKMVLKSQGGLMFFQEESVDLDGVLAPLAGNGVLVRAPGGDPIWLDDNGLIYVNNGGSGVFIANGTAGQFLMMSGGNPQWGSLPSGNIASGSGSIGLSGVMAKTLSANEVSIQAPVFTVSNGVDEVTLANVNVSVDITDPVGLGGLDTGAEASSTWYYIHIVSDGALVNAMISTDPDVPDFGATGYTYSGLASIVRNNAAGSFVLYLQRGRQFNIAALEVAADESMTASWAAVTQTTSLATIVPPNVKTVTGQAGGSSTATVNRKMAVASDTTGLGAQFIDFGDNSVAFEGFLHGAGNFIDIPIADAGAPALYWRGTNNDSHRRLTITGYKI